MLSFPGGLPPCTYLKNSAEPLGSSVSPSAILCDSCDSAIDAADVHCHMYVLVFVEH